MKRILIATALACAACGPHVDLATALAPEWVTTGWADGGAGDRTKLRDKVLRALTTPILFVQGTRDSLCPLDLLEKVRAEMKAPNVLHVVEGGDHSLLVTKRPLTASSETQDQVEQRMLEAIAQFVASVS